ncbi:MAG TPA: AAA family ATPase [Noviherbaspirillum sp.]|uniref:AAA family ATPase n=1 Tax=Noviherbaspirillum sp. TaxID=1926288 RepID=UPI002B47915C|nr:AAA family ATPase [Noviherbaspirillum sp.]HJV85981.1 AAA family ATPase [Noviherbaspirillum sp.]
MDAVIFIGIQGSGKSTFYRQHFFDTHLRISLDMLRTRHRERLFVEACIATGQRFVVDNTNVLRSERAEYILRARDAGFHVHGYFFEPQVHRAIAWNEQRTGQARIPLKGLLGTLKRMERPNLEEGFDFLYRVDVDEANEFIVKALMAPA